MLNKTPILALIVFAASLQSCSLFRSDVNSENPAIAAQAQRVESLKSQVNDQERLVDDAKSRVDAEKDRLKALKYQLKGAQQNLKGRKLEAKS